MGARAAPGLGALCGQRGAGSTPSPPFPARRPPNRAKTRSRSALYDNWKVRGEKKNLDGDILTAGDWWLLRLIKYEEWHYSAESNTKLAGSPEAGSGAVSISTLRASSARHGALARASRRSGPAISRVRRICYLIGANYPPAGMRAPTGFAGSHHGYRETQRASTTPIKTFYCHLSPFPREIPFVAGCKGLTREK